MSQDSAAAMQPGYASCIRRPWRLQQHVQQQQWLQQRAQAPAGAYAAGVDAAALPLRQASSSVPQAVKAPPQYLADAAPTLDLQSGQARLLLLLLLPCWHLYRLGPASASGGPACQGHYMSAVCGTAAAVRTVLLDQVTGGGPD
jgi:hypothetical protein